MKKTFLIILAIFLISVSIAEPVIPDSIKEIKISLQTEQEIDQAMEIIKENYPKVFQTLKRLKPQKPDDFRNKLRKHYYTWMHTQVLLKNKKKKTKGYRQAVKESEINFKKLAEAYNTETDKSSIKDQIKTEALNRYEIELTMRKFQLKQLKQILQNKEKEFKVFQKNKDIFVERIVKKTTRPQIQKK